MEFFSSLTIFDNETPFILEKRIQLLDFIEIEGSISKAAKKVPMSYKAAWDAIDTINNLCPYPVVSKETGGKGGGGAKLTPYGKNLVDSYKVLKTEHERFLNTLSKIADFDTGTLKSLKRIAMQISARNQIQGTVEYVENGKINASVFIKLKSGYTLISVITNDAVETLNIKVGDEVTAFFKSSSVLITTDFTLNISARNKFQGNIEKINVGEVNAEVIVNIGGNDKIASVITANSIKSLELTDGMEVSAVIKATDIMIGK